MKPVRVLLLAGSASSSPAFTKLSNTKTPLELLLDSCTTCKRLQPLSESVYIVLSGNEDWAQRGLPTLQEYGLTAANVISTGCADAVSDLRCAINKLGSSSHVLAISASQLTCIPGYNLQRLIEHGLTRDMDAVGLLEVGQVESTLIPNATNLVGYTYDAPHLVPMLAGLQPQSSAEEGSWQVEPVLFLTPATLAKSDALQGDGATDLQALASHLMATSQPPLHALALGQGCLRIDSPACLEYATKCVAHMLPHVQPASQVEDDTEAGGQAGELKYKHRAWPQLEQELNTFKKQYLATKAEAQGMVLPSTFYMTTYRRQAADHLR